MNKAGLITYCDPVVPAVKKRVVQGSGAAAGTRSANAPGITLGVTSRQVLYGAEEGVTLTGTVAGAAAGQAVSVIGQSCGFNASSELSKLKAGKGGVFRYQFMPGVNTTYSVQSSGRTSGTVRVVVRPYLTVTRESAGRYRVDASTTNGYFLEQHAVVLQRWSGSHWVTLRRSS